VKKKIIIALLLIFNVVVIGFFVSGYYIFNSTSELKNIIRLHEVEEMRRGLLVDIKTIQSDLYTVRTPFERDIGLIANTGLKIEESARRCFSCHHSEAIFRRFEYVQTLIQRYQEMLSNYITISANNERIEEVKRDAILTGDELFSILQGMSHVASENLKHTTTITLMKIVKAKNVLFVTILCTTALVIIIGVRLTRSITRPINILLDGTRRISSGEVGYQISYQDDTEFGEIVNHYNRMSMTLFQDYSRLQKEIKRSMDAEEALRKSEERYAYAVAAANDGLWDWNIKKNEIYLSQRWKFIIGYRDEEIEDDPEEWFKRVHPADIQRVEMAIKGLVVGLTNQFSDEHRILHKDGTYRWVLCRAIAVKDDGGNVYRIVGSTTDITERKVAEEQLFHNAFHDSLTGLPNRALFMDRLIHVSKRALRQKNYLYAVIFIDIDRFKFVNDSLGHGIGDTLLVLIAQRLEECLRSGETVARMGGDEFAVLLEDIRNIHDVENIIHRIQDILSSPFNIEDREIFATASMGVAMNSLVDNNDPELLLRNADIAMYNAKFKGGNGYEIFNHKMYEDIVERLQLESELRVAIERSEFAIHYQPIISLKSGRIIGFEALTRWFHPKKGLIPPSVFIPVAEETGMISNITKWVLYTACRQIRVWQQLYPSSPPLKVSVNISSKIFTYDLVKEIDQIISDIGIEPDSLILEITENMIIENPKSSSDLIMGLKALNVQLHIDDFGTGYSALSYLYQFPFDGLKIDRSFMGKEKITKENLEILKAIFALAENLRLDVVAEGVETPQQFEDLKSLNCTNVQGFLFSRPLEEKDVEALLRDSIQRGFSF